MHLLPFAIGMLTSVCLTPILFLTALKALLRHTEQEFTIDSRPMPARPFRARVGSLS